MLAPAGSARVWRVGALCHAIADALDAKFNPVTVSGEISGFSRAASGHCYFVLKDETGQLRCAMFRRAAGLLGFNPRDGERVEVRGRLGVYEPRGELQLIVESMTRAGQGTLFEQFLLLKAKLEGEGLFASERKRPLQPMPRAIGLVTSLGAAALHDVVTALQRRVPHIPVVLAPAAVQGAGAPAELTKALSNLYQLTQSGRGLRADSPPIDVILLVRGGGAMEDLWAFNDETLARVIASSPVPVVCGVGHETDFTIADFVADLRAPTPTAAAELAALPQEVLTDASERLGHRLQDAALRIADREAQRLDQISARLGRPSAMAHQRRMQLAALGSALSHAVRNGLRSEQHVLQQHALNLPRAVQTVSQRQRERLGRAALRLESIDPKLVLRRGYAWISGDDGHSIASVAQAHVGQHLVATMVDGAVDLAVQGIRPN